MTVELGPTERVQLREGPLGFNFCSVKIGQTLMPRSHTRVRCKASSWDEERADTAVFELGDVKLGPGLSISPGTGRAIWPLLYSCDNYGK